MPGGEEGRLGERSQIERVSYLCEMSRIAKWKETESRLVVARNGGGEVGVPANGAWSPFG